MQSFTAGSLSSVPQGRIIGFDGAELKRSPMQNGWFLSVSGVAPEAGKVARLAPRLYQERPDYWGIEVVAIRLDAGGDDGPCSGKLSIPLEGITGLKGIAVIGANRVITLDVA